MSAEQGGGSSPRVDSRQGEDGSIELVIDAPGASPGRAREETSASSSGEPVAASRRLRPWMAAPLLILVAALAFALTRSADEGGRVNTADDEPAGFRAYNGVGGVAAPEPAAAPRVAPARRAPAEPALSPEEEEAWRLAEQSNQDVVVEDEGVEEEPQRNSALMLPTDPTRRLKPLNPMAIDTSRQMPFERLRMNTKQRALMRDAMRAQEGLAPLPPEPQERVSPTLKTYVPKRMPDPNAPSVQPGFPEELPEHVPAPGDSGNIYGDGPSPYKTPGQ